MVNDLRRHHLLLQQLADEADVPQRAELQHPLLVPPLRFLLGSRQFPDLGPEIAGVLEGLLAVVQEDALEGAAFAAGLPRREGRKVRVQVGAQLGVHGAEGGLQHRLVKHELDDVLHEQPP